MVIITFPDGNIKAFENNPTGVDIAQSISDKFAHNCLAMENDGVVLDLNTRVEQDAKIRLITPKDPEALEILRHSAAHVMAQAILHLYKDAHLTIGPAVENGFYYDIDMEPLSDEAFPKIEAEMQKAIKAKLPFQARVLRPGRRDEENGERDQHQRASSLHRLDPSRALWGAKRSA